MDTKILGVGPRTAAFLREHYPTPRAKLVARDFKVSTGTAELWLSGKAPTTAHVEQMVAMFGEPYIRAVFAEAFGSGDTRIHSLEQQLFTVFVAGGIAGVVSGLNHAYGLIPSRKSLFNPLDLMRQWTIGFRRQPILALPPSTERSQLIEGLMETVPALPSPATRNS